MISPLTQIIQMNADAVIFDKAVDSGMFSATLVITFTFLVISLLIVRKFNKRIAELI